MIPRRRSGCFIPQLNSTALVDRLLLVGGWRWALGGFRADEGWSTAYSAPHCVPWGIVRVGGAWSCPERDISIFYEQALWRAVHGEAQFHIPFAIAVARES